MPNDDILKLELFAERAEKESRELLKLVRDCSPDDGWYHLQRFTIELASITMVIDSLRDFTALLEKVFADRAKYKFLWDTAKKFPFEEEERKKYIFKSGSDLKEFEKRIEDLATNIRTVRSQLPTARWY